MIWHGVNMTVDCCEFRANRKFAINLERSFGTNKKIIN